jgi:hypothetical protein
VPEHGAELTDQDAAQGRPGEIQQLIGQRLEAGIGDERRKNQRLPPLMLV